MPDTSKTEKPPSRGAKVFKALILLAVSIKLFTNVAPNHGPLFALFSGLMILGAILYLIMTIFTIC